MILPQENGVKYYFNSDLRSIKVYTLVSTWVYHKRIVKWIPGSQIIERVKPDVFTILLLARIGILWLGEDASTDQGMQKMRYYLFLRGLNGDFPAGGFDNKFRAAEGGPRWPTQTRASRICRLTNQTETPY